MVRNVMCCWWQGTHYSPSEIRTLKIGRRQTSLFCGTAYQLLPRSPTSKIHGLSWKLLSHAPPGVRRSSTMSPRVWRGCHQGGSLAIGIACVTVTPLVTGGQDTHTQMHNAFIDWKSVVCIVHVKMRKFVILFLQLNHVKDDFLFINCCCCSRALFRFLLHLLLSCPLDLVRNQIGMLLPAFCFHVVLFLAVVTHLIIVGVGMCLLSATFLSSCCYHFIFIVEILLFSSLLSYNAPLNVHFFEQFITHWLPSLFSPNHLGCGTDTRIMSSANSKHLRFLL